MHSPNHHPTTHKGVIAFLVLTLLTLQAFSASAAYNEQDESRRLIASMQSDLLDLKTQGIPTRTTEAALRDAEGAMARGDHAAVRTIAADASKEKAAAIGTAKAIKRTHDTISYGERRWQAMTQSKNMIFLARESYKRGDFTAALDRAGQAEVLANVELKATNWRWVLSTYRWKILGTILVVIIIGRIIYTRIRRSNINKRIEDLGEEEQSIIKLIRETQEKHFTRKELSAAQFHKAMFNHYHQLYANRSEMAALRRERVKRGNLIQELETLQREEQDVMNLIKTAQEDHYVKKTTTPNEYNLTMEEYHDRLAEIENSLIALQRETGPGSSEESNRAPRSGIRGRRQMMRPLRDALLRLMITEEKKGQGRRPRKGTGEGENHETI